MIVPVFIHACVIYSGSRYVYIVQEGGNIHLFFHVFTRADVEEVCAAGNKSWPILSQVCSDRLTSNRLLNAYYLPLLMYVRENRSWVDKSNCDTICLETYLCLD